MNFLPKGGQKELYELLGGQVRIHVQSMGHAIWWNLSLVPRPFVGETAWQLTRVQTVYGYDVKEITAPPVQAMNIG